MEVTPPKDNAYKVMNDQVKFSHILRVVQQSLGVLGSTHLRKFVQVESKITEGKSYLENVGNVYMGASTHQFVDSQETISDLISVMSIDHCDELHVVWDSETTGLNKGLDEPLSIGAVVCYYDMWLKKFYTLNTFHEFIRSKKSISLKAQEIHGIFKHMIRGNLGFVEVFHKYKQFLFRNKSQFNADTVVLVGHNIIKFDEQLLYVMCKKYSIDYDDFVHRLGVSYYWDTLPWLRSLMQRIQTRDSNTYQKIHPTKSSGALSMKESDVHRCWVSRTEFKAHDALEDCQALVEIMNCPIHINLYNHHMLNEFKRKNGFQKVQTDIRKSVSMIISSTNNRQQFLGSNTCVESQPFDIEDKQNSAMDTEEVTYEQDGHMQTKDCVFDLSDKNVTKRFCLKHMQYTPTEHICTLID